MFQEANKNPIIAMQQWLYSSMGNQLWQLEREHIISQSSPNGFSGYFLQIGGRHDAHFSQHPHERYFWFGEDVVADVHQLPFAPDTFHRILLIHSLEFLEQPESMIQALYQVLAPGGRITLVGFNPISLWGLAKKTAARASSQPWHGHFYCVSKIKRWLRHAGFAIESSQTLCFRPPGLTQSSWSRWLLLEPLGQFCLAGCGGIYFIVAQKTTTGMTPLSAYWKARPAKTIAGSTQSC